MLKQLVSFTCILFTALVVSNYSDDQSTVEEVSTLPPVVEKTSPTTTSKTPVVYIEELDQYQEYFKEQHETSFSHVTKKNWTSYTAGKNGILTKVLLFGKPNYTISEHYGSSMSGFVRADNPDSGPKLGEWSLSREEIVNQLALQGLTEIDQGWITLQMRGEIPQQKVDSTSLFAIKSETIVPGLVPLPSLKAMYTKRGDFGCTLITILFSAPMSARQGIR